MANNAGAVRMVMSCSESKKLIKHSGVRIVFMESNTDFYSS